MAKKVPAKKLTGLAAKVDKSLPKKLPPLWKGPEVDGVSQSLLGGFLVCRERFRVHTIEGLQSADKFNKPLEYGNMWHVCEDAHAANLNRVQTEKKLEAFCQTLCDRYRTSHEEIAKWYNVCKLQFPVYTDFWKKHPDVKDRTPLFQEQVFKIPMLLPSGRVVFLRGKFDSVDMIGKPRTGLIYLQENKTKGDIDEAMLRRQLKFDLQTMFYLTALHLLNDYMDGNIPAEIQDYAEEMLPACEFMGNLTGWNGKIGGVRYNVIRRPLSQGRHCIKQKQGQTLQGFYDELQGRIAGEPEFFFMRWKVEFTKAEVENLQRVSLIPILEQLCDWHQEVTTGTVATPKYNYQNFLMPFGVYNPLSEGYSTDVDEYLMTGSTTGLSRAKTLFPELEAE